LARRVSSICWSVHRSERARCDRPAAESDKIDLEADAESKEEDAEEGDEAETEAIDTGPDPEEVARRMGSIAKLLQQALSGIAKQGVEDPKTQKIRKKLAAEFMNSSSHRACSMR